MPICYTSFKIFQTKKSNGSDFHAHWNYDSIPHVHVCFDLEHKMLYSPHFKSRTKYVF